LKITDLEHNLICISTAEGSSYDGFVYGLPHYMEIFNMTSETMDHTTKAEVWG
jgi:hypothetical protein